MPWSKVDESEVKACSADQIAVVKDSDGTVEGCHDTEESADDQLAALNASESSRMNRATHDNLSSGDKVTWGPSDATRYGEIESIEMSGTHSPEGVDGGPEMEASDNNPVVRIRHFEQGEDGWAETDVVTVHRADNLEKIDSFPERSVGETLYRSVPVEVERDGEEDPIKMRFSSEEVADRHGTTFEMQGANLSAFRDNPVVRWAHGKDAQGRVPIARATSVSTESGDLVATLEFDQEDDFARKIESKLRRGFINAGSIAAAPQGSPEMRTVGDEEVMTFTDWELRGLSVVDIPSDPSATAMSRDASEGRLDELEQKVDRIAEALLPEDSKEAEERQECGCNGEPLTRDEAVEVATQAVTRRLEKQQERMEKMENRLEQITKQVLGKA